MIVPRSEFSERIARVRQRLHEEGLGALLIYSYKSNAIRYLTNYSPRYSVTNAALLVLPVSGEPVIFTRLPMHLEEAKRASVIQDVRVSVSGSANVGSLEQMANDCRDFLRKSGVNEGKIGLVGYGPEMGITLPLRNALPKITFVEGNYILDEMRMIKSKNELEIVRKASEIADLAYQAGLDAISERKIDNEVFATSEFTMRKHGALGTQTFFGLCSEDIVYMQPTGERIREGSVYFLETIPEYEGYWPERTGYVAVGKVEEKWEKLFKIVEGVYDKSLDAIRPMMTISELVKVTENFAKSAGIDKFEYRLGHGIGIDNIERPEFLSDTDQTVIRSGMVLALHPAIGIPGVAGAHLGGVFIVNDNSIEPLSKIEPRIPHL